jgi:hypothetical protein
MPRPDTATVKLNVRMREKLRGQLERAAKDNKTSLNIEINARLDDSFEKRQVQETLFDLSNSIMGFWKANWGKALHDLNKRGDLLNAAEALLSALDQANTNKIKSAAAKVREAIKVIDSEAGRAMRKQAGQDTGEQQ